MVSQENICRMRDYSGYFRTSKSDSGTTHENSTSNCCLGGTRETAVSSRPYQEATTSAIICFPVLPCQEMR